MPAIHSTLTSLFTDIANAIRSKTGDTGQIRAEAFPSAIQSLPTGSTTVSGTLSIDTTGIYSVFSYESVSVSVSAQDLFYAKVQNGLSQTVFEDSTLTNINSGAFADYSTIKVFSFPNVTTVGEGAFWANSASEYNIPKLTSIGNRAFTLASISEAIFPSCSSIGISAFMQCSYLTAVSFSGTLTEIPSYAFSQCTRLTSIDTSNVVSIGSAAFRGCSSLLELNTSNVTSVGQYAFCDCRKLRNITLSNLTSLESCLFWSCYSLSNVVVPNITNVAPSVFRICSSLSSIDLSKCTEIGYQAFYGAGIVNVNFSQLTKLSSMAFVNCKSLTAVTLPKLSVLSARTFESCNNLGYASFAAVSIINTSCFKYCYNLLSLYLTSTALVSLPNVNAFLSTPISDYTTSTGGVYGSVYVPASLYSQYIAATNWVTYSNRIVSI